MSQTTKVNVYAGLSLEKEEVLSIIPDAIFSPAIKRGDTLIDIRRGHHVIVIIDGRFQQSMAVSPSELMDALRCGIRIYGSSSMGAMRAVELESYGMIGHGKIYEYIKETPYFRDDYLGQVFNRDIPGSKSEPYINFMFSLLKMLEEKKIDQTTYDVLEPIYRDLHFAERDLYTLIDKIKEHFPDDPTRLINVSKQAFAEHNQKREDGLGLLQRVNSDLEKIREHNEEIRRLSEQLPEHPGHYPSQEQYDQEVAEFKKQQKKHRASYFADYLKSSEDLAAFQKKEEITSREKEEEQ